MNTLMLEQNDRRIADDISIEESNGVLEVCKTVIIIYHNDDLCFP